MLLTYELSLQLQILIDITATNINETLKLLKKKPTLLTSGYTSIYGKLSGLLFKVVLWSLAIVRKQREKIPCHIELQLGCSSFVEMISKDYLKQRAIHITAAFVSTASPPAPTGLPPDRCMYPASLQVSARKSGIRRNKAAAPAEADDPARSARVGRLSWTGTSLPVQTETAWTTI